MSARDQLSEDGPPLLVVQVFPYAVRRKLLMAKLRHLFIFRAAQYIDKMIDAKALARAVDDAQCLASRICTIPGICGLKAGVTVATGFCQVFAKVVHQALTSAGSDFAEPQHRIQAMLFRPLVLFTAFGARHHLAQLDHILQAVDHPGICRFTIAPCTTRFLIVGFHRFRHVQVSDEAHIWFIYAHTKGDGGHNDDGLLTQKTRLMISPNGGAQAGVIGQGIEALFS